MAKQQISRRELSARALAELGRQPGCAGLKQIAVTIEHIVGAGTTWHLSIVDAGDADPALLLVKARNLEDEWSDRFEVMDP